MRRDGFTLVRYRYDLHGNRDHPFKCLSGKEFFSRAVSTCTERTITPSPVHIKRGADFESPNTKGLYPAGEGAGFAGGIKIAEAVARAIAEEAAVSPASADR